jgi:predicted lipoprotein
LRREGNDYSPACKSFYCFISKFIAKYLCIRCKTAWQNPDGFAFNTKLPGNARRFCIRCKAAWQNPDGFVFNTKLPGNARRFPNRCNGLRRFWEGNAIVVTPSGKKMRM